MIEVKRDNDGIAHIVALSGGKDSTAMALRLAEVEPRPYMYICTPTGDELPEMFDHWNRLSGILGQKIWPVTYHTGFKGMCAEQKMLPNWRARFCTRLLKIGPYKNFLLHAMPAVSYVGLRADEMEREGANYGGDSVLSSPDGVTQVYPMQEWGWSESHVWDYLDSRGITIPRRTDCARCFFQTLGEWWTLWKDHPEIYADAESQEIEIEHTFRSDGRDSWPASLQELRQEFERGNTPRNANQPDLFRQATCRVCTL